MSTFAIVFCFLAILAGLIVSFAAGMIMCSKFHYDAERRADWAVDQYKKAAVNNLCMSDSQRRFEAYTSPQYRTEAAVEDNIVPFQHRSQGIPMQVQNMMDERIRQNGQATIHMQGGVIK